MQCPGPARPPLPRAGRYQGEGAGDEAARIGLRAPRAGGGRGAGGSGFRAERSHIGQRRAGFWEKGPSPPPPPARPPAKMSDMEDDFMCDDEEDYDLVGRGTARGLSGTAGGAAGAAPLRAAAGAARPPQQPPRRVLPRQGARTSKMSFPPGEEDAGRGCEGRVLLSEQPLGRFSAEEQASSGPGRWIGPAGAPAAGWPPVSPAGLTLRGGLRRAASFPLSSCPGPSVGHEVK